MFSLVKLYHSKFAFYHKTFLVSHKLLFHPKTYIPTTYYFHHKHLTSKHKVSLGEHKGLGSKCEVFGGQQTQGFSGECKCFARQKHWIFILSNLFKKKTITVELLAHLMLFCNHVKTRKNACSTAKKLIHLCFYIVFLKELAYLGIPEPRCRNHGKDIKPFSAFWNRSSESDYPEVNGGNHMSLMDSL